MSDETLRADAASRVEEICERFHADWRRGERPAVDEYVARAEPADRDVLRQKLLDLRSSLVAPSDESDAQRGHESTVETVAFSDDEPAPDTNDLPNIPGYFIVRRIGRGGMGAVFEARHQALDRPVAIKLPLAEQGPSERERFLREARAAARLRHPHICTVHEIGEVSGIPYIAMDFIQGPTLNKWRDERRPTARQTAGVVALLARAVGYAHAQGIVHRDIKPSNVIVESASGLPVLMDFGLAKHLAGDAAVLTCSGQIMGTPAYMAPEQAAGRIEDVGPLADVYALGAVLYDILCGHPPFQGSAAAVLAQLQTVEPRAPRLLNAKIHRDLETICLKALAKDCQSRYPSAVALADDLERFSAGEPILARRTPVAVRAWRRVRRNPATAALLVLFVVVAAALGVVARRTSGVFEASRVRQAFEQGLDDGQFGDEHMKHMESLLEKLAALAPAEADPARTRLYERYANLHLDSLRQQTLEPELEAQVEHAIAMLSERGQRDLVSTMRQRLEQRRQVWDNVVQLTPDTSPDRVFERGTVVRRENRLLPQVDGGTAAEPAAVFTLAESRGAVEIDATFDAGWQEASEVGVLLNASPGRAAQIVALAVSPDGARLAAGSLDGTTRLWDLRNGAVLATLRGTTSGVRDIAFSSDGLVLATASYGLKLWDLDSLMPLASPAPAGGPIRVSFLPDRYALVVADQRGEATLLDLDGAAPSVQVAGRDNVAAVALSADGSLLAVGLQDGAVEVWDVAAGNRLGALAGESPAAYLVLSRDGRRGAVVRTGKPNVVQLFDGRTGQAGRRLTLEQDVSALCFSNRGSLAIATWGGSVRLWDAATGEPKKVFAEDANYHAQMQSLAFPRDDSLLVGGAVFALCKVWNAETAAERMTLADSNYTFRLTAYGAPSKGRPRPTLQEARRSEGALLEIVRDGTRLTARTVRAEQLPAADLRLVAMREDDRLAVRLNDLPALEFYDPFPLARARPGVFGVLWPPQADLKSLRARRKALPDLPIGLEQGDDAAARGDWEVAAEAYRSAALELAGATLADEARFKLAMSLIAQERNSEARSILESLATAEGDRWPMLALCQIWVQDIRAKRLADAQHAYDQLFARFSVDKFVQVIPNDIREEIVALHRSRSRDFYLYAPDPSRVPNLERAVKIEQALGVPVDRFENTRWYLLRAYHAAGRFDEALALAEQVIADAEPGELGFGFTWADEYVWLLSLRGQAEKALAYLDRFLAAPPGLDRSPLLGLSRQSHILLLSRGQILCAQGRWDEAERDVEELFRLEPAEQMPDALRPVACLLRGMLRDRRGDREGALAAWRQGRLSDREHRVRGSARLGDIILASLIGEMSDAEAEEIGAGLFAALVDNSPLALTKNLLHLPPGVIREAWRTPRGREAAQRIAFRQVSMPELVRLPALAIAAEAARQTCFGGSVTPEEEAMTWDVAGRAFDAYAAGQLKAPQVVQALMTLKGRNDSLGWQGLKPALPAELRAPAGYIFGCRFLRLGKPHESRSLFQAAQEEAPADSPLSHLARQRLETLTAP